MFTSWRSLLRGRTCWRSPKNDSEGFSSGFHSSFMARSPESPHRSVGNDGRLGVPNVTSIRGPRRKISRRMRGTALHVLLLMLYGWGCSSLAASSPSLPALRTIHESLLTTSRRDFGHDEEAFWAAVEWHRARIRERAAAAGDADDAEASASKDADTFVAFAAHHRAREARKTLEASFSPRAVKTLSLSREHGASFLVHASTAAVDVLAADSDVRGGDIFDGFFPLPAVLKLSPSLLRFAEDLPDRDTFRQGDGPVASTGPRATTPGQALSKEGLVVLLAPGSASSSTSNMGLSAVDRWRKDWSAASLDLGDLPFMWSAQREGEALPSSFRDGVGARLAREWTGAVRMVHSLAGRRGVTVSEACGWSGMKVTMEAPGLVTLRGIGHLLPRGEDEERSEDGSGMDDTERMSCLMGMIAFLASRPETARVSALPRGQLANAVASRIIQSASESDTPLWDRGVDGSGQVVQVVDSGVGEGSCFFRHSADSAGVEHGYMKDADGTLGTGDYTSDLTQRKIVQYIEGVKGDSEFSSDDEQGHGSHVAGSVAGSIYSDWSGPVDCPAGDAYDNQTALTCVGSCLSPETMAAHIVDNQFDLDALCPEYNCDYYWEEACLTDDRNETLEEAQGMAPGAKLAILDVGSSESLDQVLGSTMWETSAGTGARLHSASWGFPDDPCAVDEATISFDTWAYENPEHLLIFAAGNMGDDVSGCSVSSPSLGKNCVSVGSSMSGAKRLTSGDMDEVSDFSSIGPTTDDRIKPDVVAPGHYIFSAGNGGDGSCELEINSGTSMSCPVVAGAGALVRQYFVDGFYGDDVSARGGLCSSTSSFSFECEAFSPSGVLVKAFLIHGANAMGGSSEPNGVHGFGRIHLESCMPFEGEGIWALYVEDDDGSTSAVGQVEAMEVEERMFNVTPDDAAAAVEAGDDGPGGIRVTLAWMDPPATTLSSSQLIHDLDLFLEGPDGTLWTMWGECSGGASTCTVDSNNNVERIVVPAEDITAGTWTVSVSAENDLVEGGPQSYALLVSLPISAGSGGGLVGGNDTSYTSTSTSSDTPAPVEAEETGAPTARGTAVTTSTASTSTPKATVAPSPAPAAAVPPTAAPTVHVTSAPADSTGAPSANSPIVPIPSVSPVGRPSPSPIAVSSSSPSAAPTSAAIAEATLATGSPTGVAREVPRDLDPAEDTPSPAASIAPPDSGDSSSLPSSSPTPVPAAETPPSDNASNGGGGTPAPAAGEGADFDALETQSPTPGSDTDAESSGAGRPFEGVFVSVAVAVFGCAIAGVSWLAAA